MSQLEHLEFRARQLEKVPCPLCSGKQFAQVLTENFLKIVKCSQCNFIFCNPRPTEEELKRFYNQYYPDDSESLWCEQMKDVFRSEGLNKIQNLKGKARVLDVGCGYGFFLKMLKDEGFETYGTEISIKAAEYGQKKLGLTISEKTLRRTKFPANYFDVVTFWYVLEHLSKPRDELFEARRILNKGGLAIIRVPNQSTRFDTILSKLGQTEGFLMNPPRHLNDFTPETLAKLLELTGFHQIEIINSCPRKTGAICQVYRRNFVWWLTEVIYYLSFGRAIWGTSLTAYARKK